MGNREFDCAVRPWATALPLQAQHLPLVALCTWLTATRGWEKPGLSARENVGLCVNFVTIVELNTTKGDSNDFTFHFNTAGPLLRD